MNMKELWRKKFKPADLSKPGREMAEDEYFCKEDGLIYCAKCRTPLETAVDVGHFGVIMRLPVSCKCRIEERERRKRAMDEAQRRARAESNRIKGIADTTYHKFRFENDRGYNAPVLKMAKKYVAGWDMVEKENGGLLIWGDTGTGKTFTAACIANALIDKGAKVMMTSLPWLVDELTGRQSRSRNEFIESLNSYDLLIIDDLGTESGSAYGLEQIYRIIDGRYRCGKPLIITTNLNPREMQAEKDVAYKRIYDRVLAMSIPLKMNELNIRRKDTAKKTKTMKSLLQD